MKHRLFLMLIILTLFWIFYALFFKADYWQSHDGDFHLQRGFVAVMAFKTGDIPLRWSSLLNYGCGLPVFNFFYPLIYYIFGVLGLLNINLVLSFKLILLLFSVIGSISIYYLSYSLFKSRLSALVGAVLFLLNPYYLSLIYVRANPELLTYCLLPLVLLLILKCRYLPLFMIFLFYLLSHNTTILITLPIIGAFIVYSFIKTKSINYFLIFTLLMSFLSAMFFLGPALTEKNFIKLGHNVAADYQQHFPTIQQLFFSPWGWGYSQTGINDGMSFKFGYVQWFILFISLIIGFKFNHRLFLLIIPLLITLYLSLSSSLWFWEKLPVLQQLQYPWRLIGLAVFLASILASAVTIYFPSKARLAIIFIILLSSLITNRHHIQVVSKSDLPDFTRIGSTTIADELLSINAVNTCYLDSHQLSYFPQAYQISVSGFPVDYYDCLGYVCLKSGETSTEKFSWKRLSTPVELLFNYVSAFSALIWTFVYLIRTFFKRIKPV